MHLVVFIEDYLFLCLHSEGLFRLIAELNRKSNEFYYDTLLNCRQALYKIALTLMTKK